MSKKLARSCQPCSACCDGWMRIKVPGINAYPGHPCVHSRGKGCNDYKQRPQNPCIDFQCGWIIADSPLPAWFKPNKARTIVIFNKLQWQGFPVDIAIAVGKKIPPRALSWLKNFAEQNSRPLIYSGQSKGVLHKEQPVLAYGPPEFQKQVTEWEKSGIVLW